VRRIE